MTLANIINCWLSYKGYDGFFVVSDSVFQYPVLMFKPDIVAFHHTQQHFIAFIRDADLIWWNNTFDPYDWPKSLGPTPKPLSAISYTFFDELDGILTKLSARYFK
jgi:hypothetical protein